MGHTLLRCHILLPNEACLTEAYQHTWSRRGISTNVGDILKKTQDCVSTCSSNRLYAFFCQSSPPNLGLQIYSCCTHLLFQDMFHVAEHILLQLALNVVGHIYCYSTSNLLPDSFTVA